MGGEAAWAATVLQYCLQLPRNAYLCTRDSYIRRARTVQLHLPPVRTGDQAVHTCTFPVAQYDCRHWPQSPNRLIIPV